MTTKKSTAAEKKTPAKKNTKKATEEIQETTITNDQETTTVDIPSGDTEHADTSGQSVDISSASEQAADPSAVIGNQDTSEEEETTLLIPYLKSEAAGDELKYAMRNWDKNFRGKLRVVIVGDREDWFSEDIVHIPHEVHTIDEDCGCDNPNKIRNPQADVAHKLLTAIASGEITGDFILSNDDIFILGDTTLADISYLRVFGTLEKGTGKDGGLYQENAVRTAHLLKSKGLPTYRYGTHTPVLLNADLLAEVIKEYNATERGTLLTSLYFNHHYPDARGMVSVTGNKDCTILASVYRANPDLKVLNQALKRRKFVNCNAAGWKALKPIFEAEYPDKSRFEN